MAGALTHPPALPSPARGFGAGGAQAGERRTACRPSRRERERGRGGKGSGGRRVGGREGGRKGERGEGEGLSRAARRRESQYAAELPNIWILL
eukprot:scaffold184829_cov30-Tisochrysis_lutea.AAC.3